MTDFTTVYKFLTGQFLWFTLIVFLCGSIYRIYRMISLARKKESFIFTHISLKFSLRSIIHWIIPFWAVNWRKHPFITIVTFVFHGGIVIMPFSISAHLVLFEMAWDISWPSIPDIFVDAMTISVVAASILFLIRRLILKEVRFLTTPSDYFILAIACAPFITGFFAYHQIGYYRLWMILHIVTGELMIMAIPFTRLSHMLYGVFTRAYSGSEFGGVRHARDW